MSSTPSRSETATAHDPGVEAATAREPHLFVVLEGARLDAGGARIGLAPFASISIGRGRERRVSRSHRQLELAIPDPLLSSRHLRLDVDISGWQVSDLDSKNGTYVNGHAVGNQRLSDGDFIEVGQTLLRYRELPAAAGDELAEIAASTRALGVGTLLDGLARQFDDLASVAATDIPVLVTGASGTGKEIAARAIHEISGRAGELVAVNCGALPHGLVESQLFGHQRGAFSGADRDAVGLIRAAAGSTLLLDEIGDLPATAQAALLRTLESGEVLPVGAARAELVDFRLIAATHRDLGAMATAGDFRGDLLARISGFRFELPPLAERLEDLGELVAAATQAIPELAGSTLTRAAARCLVGYPWPHNIRELFASLRAAAALAGSDPITPEHLPPVVRESQTDSLGPDDRARRQQLIELLRNSAGNVSAVARELGKARMQVQRWLKRYGIDPATFR